MSLFVELYEEALERLEQGGLQKAQAVNLLDELCVAYYFETWMADS